MSQFDRHAIERAIRQNNGRPQGVDLANVDLSGERLDRLNLEGAVLNGANLANTSMINCNLENTHLRKANLLNACLWHANLSKADLRGASLRNADFLDVILKETNFGRRELDGIVMQEANKDFAEAQVVYLTLRLNFSTLGRHDDVSWAYFKERQMERKAASLMQHIKRTKTDLQRFRQGSRFSVPATVFAYCKSSLWEYISLVVKEYFWGYGERPFRIFYVAIAVLLGYTGLYYLLGGLTSTSSQPIDYMDLFTYSLSAFVGQNHPSIIPTTQLAQLMTYTETASGIAVLTMLLFAFSQRITAR